MTTVIRLDGSAIAKLLELDPNFKLELQRGVLSEIAGKLYKNDIATDVRKLLVEVFEGHKNDLVNAVQEDQALRAELDKKLAATVASIRAGGYGYTVQKKLPDELHALLNRAVEQKIGEAVEAQVGTVARRVKEATELLTKRIEDRLLNTLERDWKAEAVRQIREDVARTITEAFGAKA